MTIFRRRKLGIKTKILLVIFFISIFVITLGVVINIGMTQLNRSAKQISSINLVNAIHVGNLISVSKSIDSNMYLIVYYKNDKKKSSELVSNLQSFLDDYNKYDKMYTSGSMAEEEKILYNKQNESWVKLKPIISNIIGIFSDEAEKNKEKVIDIILQDYATFSQDHQSSLDNLFTFQNDEGYKWVSIIQKSSALWLWITVISIFIVVLLSLCMGVFLSKHLGKLFDKIQNQIDEDANILLLKSKEINSTSEELTLNVDKQKNSIERTATAVHEINEALNKNSNSADDSVNLAAKTSKLAENGSESVSLMSLSVEKINESMLEIEKEILQNNENLSSFVKIIHEIGAKTNIINDIVFQTKLLSFNASVEAARAGVHGAGFAIVAEEIGSLAKSTGLAAVEITNLLNESSDKVTKTADKSKQSLSHIMEVSKSNIENSIKTAKECAQGLDEISIAAKHVQSNIELIAKTIKEQTHAIGEIDIAVQELSLVSQNISKISDNSVLLSKSLNEKSNSLHDVVSKLKIIILGVDLNK